MKLYSVALQKWYENKKQALYSWNMFMLVLAGEELIFSPVANVAVFWICSGNTVDNSRFILTEWGPFLPLPASSQQGEAGCTWSCTWSWAKDRAGDVPSAGVCLPRWPWCVVESCFPAHGWTLTCKWEVVNELLVLLCLHVQLLLSLLSWIHLNSQNFSLSLFSFSSQPEWQGTQ